MELTLARKAKKDASNEQNKGNHDLQIITKYKSPRDV